jgi:hypothetical protein
MEHFPLAICDFQTTHKMWKLKLKLRKCDYYRHLLVIWNFYVITFVSDLRQVGGFFRELRLPPILRQKIPELFTRHSRVFPYRQYFKWPADVANNHTSVALIWVFTFCVSSENRKSRVENVPWRVVSCCK